MRINPEGLSPYTLSVRIRILKDNETLYGSGVSELLQLTDKYHSLHKAAGEIKMPYRKALKIVQRAEEQFGKKILEKTIGGAGGGGSKLTEFGHYIVEQFNLLEEDASHYIEQLVEKYLSVEEILKEDKGL